MCLAKRNASTLCYFQEVFEVPRWWGCIVQVVSNLPTSRSNVDYELRQKAWTGAAERTNNVFARPKLKGKNKRQLEPAVHDSSNFLTNCGGPADLPELSVLSQGNRVGGWKQGNVEPDKYEVGFHTDNLRCRGCLLTCRRIQAQPELLYIRDHYKN
jgi:hypothetical protein